MPAALMLHETDPRQDLLEKVGDLDGLVLLNNQVLCAVYLRPEKTRGGIILTDSTRDEDKSQGKVGLIIKAGPAAFDDASGGWFKDAKAALHEWIFFRASDGWAITINGQLCRILDDTNVRGTIQQPDQVW